MPSLKDESVLIIGRGSGIARAIALAVCEEGGPASSFILREARGNTGSPAAMERNV